MKRIWAAAAFAVFIAISIGTYYVQASINRLPQFQLVKLDGDEAEAKPLVLNALYVQLPYREFVSITTEGSKYRGERSLMERLNEPSRYPALTREYPNFMRSNPYTGLYLNDNDYLVRVETETVRTNSRDAIFRLHVAVLDKKTSRIRHFDTTMPVNGPKYGWMRTMDVQRSGSHLKIAVESNSATPDGGNKTEQHLYDVNISDGKMMGDHTLSFNQIQRPGKTLNVSSVYESDSTRPNKYLLLSVTVNGIPRNQESTSNGGKESAEVQSTVEQEYIAVYHYDSGKIDFLTWPDSKPQEGFTRQVYQDGEHVLWSKMNGNEVKLNRYRLSDNQLENKLVLKKEVVQAESIAGMRFGANRMYLLLQTGEKTSVAALETPGGRIVYRGEIAAKNGNDSGKQQLHNLQNLSFTVME